MSVDFDFGNFLDLQNQATLRINCVRFFEYLCFQDSSQEEVEVLRKEIVSDPISESFSGFYESICCFKSGDHKSVFKVFPHLNLMINTLNGNDESDVEIGRVRLRLTENLEYFYDAVFTMHDIWIIAQIHEFIEHGSGLGINLIRIIDLNLSSPDVITEIKDILKGQDTNLNMDQFLTRLLAQEKQGFVTGELRQVLLDRGVEERFVNLVTKESVKNLTKEKLSSSRLFLISFKEEMLDEEPDFIDKITENGIILTSTAAESEKGFVFLVLSTNDKNVSFFNSHDKIIIEVG